MPLSHGFWPEDPVLIGYALESGPNAEGFLRTAIDSGLLRVAWQLRQFLPSEVDLSKWL